MATITVKGGEALGGRVTVSGSKNAVLPIIFASLLTKGESVIRRVPDIGDVRVATGIIESLGARCERSGDTLLINTERLTFRRPNDNLVSQIRASTYLLGASLARFGIAAIQSFGGCDFCKRPIDLHLLACRAFGADVRGDGIFSHGLRGASIRFSKASVGATVNAILLAATAHGSSRIENFAREPHIFNLIDYLRSAGADIQVLENVIIIHGRELHGGDATIDGDPIEAGTYAALSAITGGNITVLGVSYSALESYLAPLLEVGAQLDTDGGITLRTLPKEHTSIVAEPYPGFPTDLQPIAAPILACARGGTIEDRVWQGRFGYLAALAPFGVRYRAYPTGSEIFPSELRAADTIAPDLRGGAAALLIALAAVGESRIRSSEIIARGYENIEKKLRTLGAEIRIDN